MKQVITENKCQFIYTIENDFIIILDLDKGKSVTNDAEEVLECIKLLEHIDPGRFHIIYKDTEGRWDAISYSSVFGLLGFIPIGGTDEKEAIEIFKKTIHYK